MVQRRTGGCSRYEAVCDGMVQQYVEISKMTESINESKTWDGEDRGILLDECHSEAAAQQMNLREKGEI